MVEAASALAEAGRDGFNDASTIENHPVLSRLASEPQTSHSWQQLLQRIEQNQPLVQVSVVGWTSVLRAAYPLLRTITLTVIYLGALWDTHFYVYPADYYPQNENQGHGYCKGIGLAWHWLALVVIVFTIPKNSRTVFAYYCAGFRVGVAFALFAALLVIALVFLFKVKRYFGWVQSGRYRSYDIRFFKGFNQLIFPPPVSTVPQKPNGCTNSHFPRTVDVALTHRRTSYPETLNF